jgi:hypothetical protein
VCVPASAVGVYVIVAVHVALSVDTGESEQEAGLNVPLPLLTEKTTVPVGLAFVTTKGGVLVSEPVSVTVTVHVVDSFRFRVLFAQLSAVVVAWPDSTMTVPVSVSSLK